MKKFSIIGLVILIFMFVSACEKNNPEQNPPDKTNPQVTISTNSQTLSSTGGNATIIFTTNGSWSATSNVDWITLSQTAGQSGNNSVTITVKENEGYDQRDGLIIISSGEESKSISVIQKQKDALLLTSNSLILDDAGGTPSIEIKSNIEYTCTVEESAKLWISIVSTKGLTTSNIVLNISKNTSTSDRQGNILVSSGDIQEVVTVYQKSRSANSTTSLEGTSWYYKDSEGKITIFSFRTDGTFICSTSDFIPSTNYTSGTFSYSGSSIKIIFTNNADSSIKSFISYFTLNKTYNAEIIDNVLYIYNTGSSVIRLFKL